MLFRILGIKPDNTLIPLVRIEEKHCSDVIISFYADSSHMSLHHDPNRKRIQFTWWDPNKEIGVWDNDKRGAAKAQCYKNWEKHGNYYVNREISFYLTDLNIESFFPMGIISTCCVGTMKDKYLNSENSVINLNNDYVQFEFNYYPEKPKLGNDHCIVLKTFLGFIMLKIN